MGWVIVEKLGPVPFWCRAKPSYANFPRKSAVYVFVFKIV